MVSALAGAGINWIDIVVIVAYFALVFCVGLCASKFSKRDSMNGYFLASRSMNWVLVGSSLFASNIGSASFVGLAGSGAESGITVAGFELNALFIVLILGWLFLPIYLASGVFTMPEYLFKRFGGQRIRIFLSLLSLMLYIFTKLSADLYAGALYVQLSLGLNLYVAVIGLLVASAVFTVAGGQTAVIWTDFFETTLIIVGGLTVSILGFHAAGGYDKVLHDFYYKQPNATNVGYDLNNESCSQVSDYYYHLFRPVTDSDYPWTGMIFGVTISNVWYWCTDQVIVQRTLSSKDYTTAKGASILTGYLKILPLFLMVFPGMIARVLFTDEVACSNPEVCQEICGMPSGCSNLAYPLLVLRVMPEGARGLMLAVMMAALMSSLSAVFNSSSTLFTIDIWTRIRKHASEMELLIVGRSFVLIMVGVAIAWIPIVQGGANSTLINYIQSVTSYLCPPISAVFFMAVLTERINEKGAFWSLVIGLVIGLIRFCLDFTYTAPTCGSGLPDTRPAILAKVHYLHFGCILFVISGLIAFTISIMTEPIDKKHLYRLTFWSIKNREIRQPIGESNELHGTQNPGFQNDLPLPPPESSPAYTNFESGPDPSEEIGMSKPPPVWRFFYFVCGVSTSLRKSAKYEAPVLTPIEELENASFMLLEKPIWKRISDFNGVLLLAVAVAVWGYFG